jgi:hypothetical protein
VPVPGLALEGTSAAADSVARKVCVAIVVGVAFIIGVELQPANTMAVASRLARNRVGKGVMAVSVRAKDCFCPVASPPGSDAA